MLERNVAEIWNFIGLGDFGAARTALLLKKDSIAAGCR
jgi:hypothetical protein